MRVQKYIAHSGLCSRRQAEKLIEEKRVSINGKIVEEQGLKIDPEKDIVLVDGKKIEKKEETVYIMLNKPVFYITSTKDTRNRKLVSDLVNDIDARLVPVGRLDFETRGLLFMSNDGEFVNLMTHPRYEIEKTYHAKANAILSENDLNQFRKGLEIEDYITKEAKINFLREVNGLFEYEVKIEEGRNRQIRKMFKALSYDIVDLKRVAIEDILLNDLKIGKYRFLTTQEVDYLKNIARKNFKGRG